jgi:hypothetical protein
MSVFDGLRDVDSIPVLWDALGLVLYLAPIAVIAWVVAEIATRFLLDEQLLMAMGITP